MKELNICLTPDNKYVKPCIATMQSICIQNCDSAKVKFHILEGGLTDSNIEQMRKIIGYHKNANIRFIRVDDKQFSEFYTSNWGTAATYRFKIGQLLTDLDRVLYIDSDTIIKGSLEELYFTDLKNNVMAMVPDIWSDKQLKRFPNKKQPYFNTGVCLINLKKWRDEKIDIQLIEYHRAHLSECFFPDQDPINAVLDSRIYELDYKYNFCWHWDRNDYFLKNGEQSINDAVIVHYIFNKPWWSTCIHPYANFYYDIIETLPEEVKIFCKCTQKQRINKVKFTLFKFLPFIKHTNYYRIKDWRLFGFIPLLKIQKNGNEHKYYVFGLETISIVSDKTGPDVELIKDFARY